MVQTQMPTSVAEGLCNTPGTCTLVTDYHEGYESNSGVLYRLNKTSLPRAVLNLTGGSYSAPDSSTLWSSTYSDALGRPVTQIAAGGLVTRNTYAIEALAIGGVTTNYQLATTIEDAEDPAKDVITKNYSDTFGRLRVVVPAEGSRIVYAYDSMDRLVKVDQVRSDTLATFITTTLTYDWAGRKTKMDDPAMGVWEYTYDAAGNLIFQKNEDNKNTCLYYDGANRLTGKIYKGANVSCEQNPLVYNVKYNYDAGTDGKGQRTSMVDASGTTTWTYNQLGMAKSEQRVINQLPAGSNTFTLGYEYDDSGAMTAITYPDGEKVTTTYSASGQAKGLTSTSGNTFVSNVQYDALGRRTNVNYGNGLTAAYTYFAWNAVKTENRGNLQQVNLTNPQNVSLFTQSFAGYDQAGNILGMTLTSPNTGSQTVTYNYDRLYRLLTATTSGGAIPGYNLSYAFHPTGRIQSATQNGVINNYLYNDSLGHSTAVTGFGSNTYAYDALGNMKTRTENGITYTQEWTPENKLKKVTWTNDNRQYTTTFVYDGNGNRTLQIEKIIEPGNIVKEITTLYIGGVFEKQFITSNFTDYFGALAAVQMPDGSIQGGPGKGLAVLTTSSARESKSNSEDMSVKAENASHALLFSVESAQKPAAQAAITYTNWTLGKTWPYAGKVILLVTNAHMAGSDGDGKDAKWPVINGWVQNFLPADNGVATSYYEFSYDLPANTPFSFTTGMWYNFSDQYLDNYRSNSGTFTTTTFACGPHGRADVMQQRATAIKSAHMRGEEVKHFCFDAMWPWPGDGNGDYDDMMLIALWYPNDEVQPTLGFAGATSNVWYNVNKTITPASSDASGIAVQYVSTYNGGWVSSFTATQSTDVYCYAKDTYGNEKSGKCGTVLIDKAPPTLPVASCFARNDDPYNPSEDVLNNTWQKDYNRPTFSWSGATDAVSGVSGYNIYWGTNPAGTSSTWSTSKTYVAGVATTGIWYLRLRVKDVAGNYSDWFTAFTFKFDNIPPANVAAIVETHGVINGEWQNTISDPAFTWTAASDANSGLAGYFIQWDMTTITIGSPSFDPAGVGQSGESTLTIFAVDQAGNYSTTPSSFTFRYDGVPPANPSVAVEANGVVNGAWTNRSNPSFTWSGASAMSGVAGYNVCWGPDSNEVCTFITSEAYTPLPLSANGTYSLRVQTKDNAGNYAATSGTLFTYRFDSIAPVVGTPTLNIQSGSANILYDQVNRKLFYSTHSSGAISLGATITDSLSGADRMEFPAMLGQAGQTAMTAPYTNSYPITGSESSVGAFRLTGFDQAGNSAQSAALVLVRDLTGPAMNTAEAPNTAGLMIPVRWAGADEFGGAGLRSYNVDVREGTGEWSRWLSETTQTQADFGGEDGKQYTFRVQGVDRVGNAGAWLETATAATYAVTKYYAMAGQRIAMRQGSAVSYLYGDHLGSTSLITDASGTTVTETRYQPYGQPYWQWGATRTDYGFTGQRLDGFGLMDYNARYYSSTLGRFISPDSIIPQPGSPLAWDRYSYVYSNPVRYTDPSGHKACYGFDINGDCNVDTDWQKNKSPSSVSNATTSSLFLYNTTGWGTGYLSDQGYQDYGNQRPLSSLSESMSEMGGTVIWNGYVASGNPYKDDLGESIYQDIIAKIQSDKNAMIYLVGHSAGTDAVIYALFLLNQNHPEMMNNIRGVAILDVQLVDSDDPTTSHQEITNAMGASVSTALDGRVFYGKSSSYEEYYKSSNGRPGFLMNTSTTINSYENLDHYQLAVDPTVMQGIKTFFGW